MISKARQARVDAILERELTRQRRWSLYVKGRLSSVIAEMIARAASVKDRIEEVRLIGREERVLEIGPGPNGMIFFFDAQQKIAVDPLAEHFPELFPQWSNRADVLTAWGEALPFVDGYFAIVLARRC